MPGINTVSKPLDRDLREPLAANVIDLDYVRTLFLFRWIIFEEHSLLPTNGHKTCSRQKKTGCRSDVDLYV